MKRSRKAIRASEPRLLFHARRGRVAKVFVLKVYAGSWQFFAEHNDKREGPTFPTWAAAVEYARGQNWKMANR